MSARTDGWLARVGASADALESDLLGIDPRRTRQAIAALAALSALVLASHFTRIIPVGGAPLETHSEVFDSLFALVIALATVAITVAPIAYAAWNGGPGLAFAAPLVPVVLGEFLAGRFVLDLDWAVALTVGAAAAATALYAAEVRDTGSLTPWTVRAADETRLLTATALSLVALAGVGSFVTAVPSHVLEWYRPFAPLWLVPVLVLGVCWAGAAGIAVGRDETDGRSNP